MILYELVHDTLWIYDFRDISRPAKDPTPRLPGPWSGTPAPFTWDPGERPQEGQGRSHPQNWHRKHRWENLRHFETFGQISSNIPSWPMINGNHEIHVQFRLTFLSMAGSTMIHSRSANKTGVFWSCCAWRGLLCGRFEESPMSSDVFVGSLWWVSGWWLWLFVETTKESLHIDHLAFLHTIIRSCGVKLSTVAGCLQNVEILLISSLTVLPGASRWRRTMWIISADFGCWHSLNHRCCICQ